jgi:hypothetical protein
VTSKKTAQYIWTPRLSYVGFGYLLAINRAKTCGWNHYKDPYKKTVTNKSSTNGNLVWERPKTVRVKKSKIAIYKTLLQFSVPCIFNSTLSFSQQIHKLFKTLHLQWRCPNMFRSLCAILMGANRPPPPPNTRFFKLWFSYGSPEDGEQTSKHAGTTSWTMWFLKWFVHLLEQYKCDIKLCKNAWQGCSPSNNCRTYCVEADSCYKRCILLRGEAF